MGGRETQGMPGENYDWRRQAHGGRPQIQRPSCDSENDARESDKPNHILQQLRGEYSGLNYFSLRRIEGQTTSADAAPFW